MKPAAPPRIKALSFDVGGTLIEPWPSVGAVYAEVAARHGYPELDPALLKQRFLRAWSQRRNFNYTRAEWAALVDETFAGLTSAPPSTSFFDALYARFAEPDAWHVFTDVLPALNQLASAGLRLGIISNWDERLRPLLHRLDLARWFDPIIISCEVGRTKPDPSLFEAAARHWQLLPGSLLHVGDSATEDIAGARAADWQARRLDRNGGANGAETVANLGELAHSITAYNNI